MASPMEQFEIKVLHPIQAGGYDLSFTNSSLWMLVALLGVAAFLFIGTARPQLVPGRAQAAVEYVYDFVRKMLDENVGPEGRRFAPLIFSVFIFVLACNLLGLIPWVGAFTPTSHVAVTLGLAVITFSIVVIVGFWKHGLHFLSLFVPPGVPLIGKIALFPIEFISFMVRPFSLGLRPFIAMFAGHILLEIFGNFIVEGFNAGGGGIAVSVLAFLFVAFINTLELLVAAIQAYVFAILTALYINDAVNLH